jgi:glutathione S-transferase
MHQVRRISAFLFVAIYFKTSSVSAFTSLRNPFLPKQEQQLVDTSKGQPFLESLNLESSLEPKVLYTEPKQFLDVATAFMPFIFRRGSGSFAEGYKINIVPRDDTKYSFARIGNYQLSETCARDSTPVMNRGPVIIYEFEGCPFCRKVREAVSILSLDVEFRPCAQGSTWRKEIKDKYGKMATFPFMIDPNTGVEMFESNDIIEYLWRLYGCGEVPDSLTSPFTPFTAGVGLLFRIGRGNKVRSSDPPEKPLILWSGEGSSYSKLVKEVLCELDISYIQKSCPRGSPNRQLMFEKTGRFQIPFLEDPNHDVQLFESSAIIEYLEKVYSVEKPKVEYM